MCSSDLDYPPTYFKDSKTGEATGLAVDVMNAVAARAGMKVSFIFGKPWEEIEEMVLDGRADVIPLRSINPKNSERFLFSDTFDPAGVNWIVRKGSTLAFPIPKGTSVGVMNGGSPHAYLKKEKPELVPVPYESAQEILLALLSGKIDSIFYVAENLMHVARIADLDDRLTVIDPPVIELMRGLAVRKDDSELCDRLNLALHEYRDSPEAGEHFRKWLSSKPHNIWEHPYAQTGAAIVTLLLLILFIWHYLYIRRTGKRLRQSEEHLSTMLCSIGDGVIACDREGRITSLNHAAEVLTGWTSAEATGQPLETVSRLIPDQTRTPSENPVARALAEGVNVDMVNHTVLIARGGAEYKITYSCAPIQDVSGSVTGAVLVFHDVTEEYQRQEKLRESETWNRALFIDSPDTFLVLQDGIVVDCNRMAEIMLRGERSEIIERSPDIFSPEFQPDGRRSADAAKTKLAEASQKGYVAFE